MIVLCESTDSQAFNRQINELCSFHVVQWGTLHQLTIVTLLKDPLPPSFDLYRHVKSSLTLHKTLTPTHHVMGFSSL